MSADSTAAAMTDGNAAVGSARQRPRHFWEGPDPVAEEKKQRSSPVARLYQHALESVFGFLELSDLSRVMAASQEWSACVLRMPCARLHTSCALYDLTSLGASGLSAHVTTMSLWRSDLPGSNDLTSEALYVLALRMPQLTKLQCEITQAATDRVILPHKLNSLELNFSKLADAAVNTVIKGISQLNALVKLKLDLPSFPSAISFAPLAATASLQDLELAADSQPTAAHLDQLRSLAQLRKMAVDGLSSQSLERLLRDPHALRWQEIHTVRRTDAVASAALSSLPSLTSLKAWYCTDISFLAHLVQLRTFDLHMNWPPLPASADAVVDDLSCCTQLADLKITAPLNGKHLSVLLPRLPLLTKLRLWHMHELESLECLRSGPIVSRLKSLLLFRCAHAALRSRELQHVYALTALEDLTIDEMFAGEPFSSLELQLHMPPSKLMPQLKHFHYIPLPKNNA